MGKDTPFLYFSLAYFTGKRTYLANTTMAASIKLKLPDGEWTCCWVDNFCYSKDLHGDGISVSCLVSYISSNGSIKTIYSPLNSLYRTVIGIKLIVRNGTANSLVSNPQQHRKIYRVEVTENSLFEASTRFYNHLNLNYDQYKQAMTDSPQFRVLTSKLRVPPQFAYAYVHCLPNPDSNSSLQHFIIPSYEVLRYFFLQGNRLPHHLLSYFTGKADKEKSVCQGIPDLVAHPNEKPLIMLHKGERIAFLKVKEGLSQVEVSCLARIAFLPQAVDCLDETRDSLLLNSARPDKLPKDKSAYRSIRTILPQNQPFTIAVCGREFSWQGNSYLLVDQLYDTDETLPFDKISYLPLVDHRSKAIPPNPASQQHTLRSKTIPSESTQLTADEPGNTSQPATFTDFVDTVSVFGPKPEVVRLPKKDQTDQYHTAGTSQETSELLSLLEQGSEKAGPGRIQVNGDVPDTISDADGEVKNFFKALTLLHNIMVVLKM